MSLLLGIDFGTSTNYITRWNELKGDVEPEICLSQYGKSYTFSNVIYYESPTNYVLGEIARQKGVIDPLNVVEEVKRRIETENWTQRIPNLNKEVTAREVALDIFTGIKKSVEKSHGGALIDGIIISIPFAFQNRERQKIKKAAEKAGFKVLGLIEEPVAAAIRFGLLSSKHHSSGKDKILIFDLGGGTLDITVFELFRDKNGNLRIEVINTAGKKDLGGRNIDELLVRKFQEHWGFIIADIPDNDYRKTAHYELMQLACEVKELLSESQEEQIDWYNQLTKKAYTMRITVEQLEQWIRQDGIIADIRSVIVDALALKDKDLEPEEIDRIILVGGSSKIPLIEKEIKQYFKKKPEKVSEPGLLVGEGAGIYCGHHGASNSEYEIIVKISHSIGIKVEGGIFDILIERNANYETYSEIKYYSLTKSDISKKIDVRQGNSKIASQCSPVGTIEIDANNFPEHRFGIQLGTDKNGIIQYRLFDGNGRKIRDGGFNYE